MDFEELRKKKTTGDISVYEGLVMKELFMDRHIGMYLKENVDEFMALIREQMVKDRLDGIESTADIPKIRPDKMYEYIEILRDRLANAQLILERNEFTGARVRKNHRRDDCR